MQPENYRTIGPLLGIPVDTAVVHEPIPEGSEITIIDWDHNGIESLIMWKHRKFTVHTNTLTNVYDPVSACH